MDSRDRFAVRRQQRAPRFEAFAALFSRLSAKLAGASGPDVARKVDDGLQELLDFFGVDQCGILEVQPDVRQARLRHVAAVQGYPRAPTTIEYGSRFPSIHETTVLRGEMHVQSRLDDLPKDAFVDRASAAELGVECLIAIPVGVAGRVTHVLCLTHRAPIVAWSGPVLEMLRTIAESFLAALARHNAEAALGRSERSLAEAQRIAGVGSFVCDWHDDTLTGSDEANRIFGAPLTGAARAVLDRVHPEDRARVEAALVASTEPPRTTIDTEYRILRPDLSVRTIRSSIEATPIEHGRGLRTTVTLQDVSDLRAAELEARQLRAELRHADRAAHLGALVASLSHELNQPLTGILANAQAALRQLDRAALAPGELREILLAIERDDKRAAAVVANLRAMLRREEAPRSRFDLGGAVADVLGLYRSDLESRRIDVDCDTEHGCVAFAERTQILQVLLNLLSNAAHATEVRPEGMRRIELRLRRDGPDTAVIVVRDNGSGIASDRLDRIFEPFFTTRPEGLGMGLAVSRSIVEAHGGRIDATNNDSEGATFRVTLPVERVTAFHGVPPVDAPCPVDEAAPDASVCIVDDDAGARLALGRLLSAAGWSVQSFASPSEALASDALARARCLVLDVQMPAMSGLDLHAELARRGLDVPTVFLTARGDVETGVDAMKRGAVEYLTKPVDDRRLLESVRLAAVRARAREREAALRASIVLRLERLTGRERDVLRQVVAGRLNKQIAAVLGISEATVKQHRGIVMTKMGARSVAELVRLCEAARFA